MSSDNAYGAFLDQANQDTGASASASKKTEGAALKTTDTDVPAVLQSVDRYYTSDADEPFEVVSLRWEGDGLPGERTFLTGFFLVFVRSLVCRLVPLPFTAPTSPPP